MAANFKIDNYSDANIKEKTELNADADKAQAVVTVLSTQNLSNNDYVLVGIIGGDTSELKQISSISGANVTLSANLANDHTRYEKFYKLLGNKIRIYRASNVDGSVPADGSFSLLDTIDIDPDDASTMYSDSSGSSDYWYKAIFYNSTNTEASLLSDAIAMRGGGVGDYCSIEDIRREAGLKTNRFVTDADIDKKRKAAQDEINGALIGLYTVPFEDPIPDTIVDITTRLAAGLLLTSSLGKYINTSTEGKDKLDAARADLKNLQEKMKVIVVNGESIASQNVRSFSMYPDSSTARSDVDDDGRMFSVTERY